MTDKKRIRERTYSPIGEHSLTKQEFKDDCCIDTIMSRYKQTGLITHGNDKTPIYDDFSNVVSYQEAQNITIHANASFMRLPSYIRNHFDNDPGQFVDFAMDPANHDQMVKMGLAKATSIPAKQEPAPQPEPKSPKKPYKAIPEQPDLPGTD